MDLEGGDLAVGVNQLGVLFAGVGTVGGFGFVGGGVDDHARGGEWNAKLVEGDVRDKRA